MKTRFSKIALVLLLVVSLVVPMVPFTASADATEYTEASFGEGKLLITTVYNGSNYYLPATTTSKAPVATSYTDVTEIAEEHLWTVTLAEDSSDTYYIQNSEGNYLYATSANNGVRVDSTKHAWQYDSTNNSFKDTTVNRYLGIYNAQDWRCYTTVNQSNYKESSTSFKFYTVSQGSSEPSTDPSINVTAAQKYVAVDDTLTLTANTANLTGDVAWTSSNNEVATVDKEGVVTGVSMGKATITATVEADGVYDTFDVTVYPASGTVTIAEALEICEFTGTTTTPFAYTVEGTVESIDTAYDSTYGNITVTITDGTDSIVVFRMKGGESLAVDQKIVVVGNLVNFVNYNSTTPESLQKVLNMSLYLTIIPLL